MMNRNKILLVGSVTGLVLLFQNCSFINTAHRLNTPYVASANDIISTLASDVLPDAVPGISKSSSDCMTYDEKIRLADYLKSDIDSGSIPNCDRKFLKPVRSILATTYYDSSSPGSTFSCLKYRHNKSGVSYLKLAIQQVVDYGDEKLASTHTSHSSKACMGEVLYRWAKAKALLKTEKGANVQASFVRMWSTAAFASVYAKYKNQIDSGVSPHKRKKIQAWIHELAKMVNKDVKKLDRKNKLEANNMNIWRAYTLLTSVIATNDLNHLKQSHRIFRMAMKEITNGGSQADPSSKGYLPLELKRGSRAQSYHGFALTPLLGMYHNSKALNCRFVKSDRDLWQVALLFRKTIEGSRYPQVFESAVNDHFPRYGSGEARQTDIANVDNLVVLLGKDWRGRRIKQRMDAYLRYKGIRRSNSFSDSDLKERNLGGHIGNLPAPGAYPPTSAKIRKFCRGT